MDKKIFGIRVGTIITMLVCVVLALSIWMLVKYKTSGTLPEATETACISNQAI